VERIGLVVHPSRQIDRPLATIAEWADARGIEVVQVPARGAMRMVAPLGEVSACDLVVAVGGDGTVLTALRSAADHATPVLGIACGSLGALSAVMANETAGALDRYETGDWSRRSLSTLEAFVDGSKVAWSLNDFVLARRGIGQLIVEVSAGDELYVRMAGDGAIVATPLGSSAYTMGAGGPILAAGTGALVVTPLVMHGGSAPPLVVPSGVDVTLEAHPGFGGFDVEVDGHEQEVEGRKFVLRLAEERATLVSLGDPGLGLTALRRRGLITDSPRVLARDTREPGERR
jgi:NAD+ kinase